MPDRAAPSPKRSFHHEIKVLRPVHRERVWVAQRFTAAMARFF